jgi:hypothetical protein
MEYVEADSTARLYNTLSPPDTLRRRLIKAGTTNDARARPVVAQLRE